VTNFETESLPRDCRCLGGITAAGFVRRTDSQQPHFTRDGGARVRSLPPDKVHGIWVPGPGSYRRNDAGDSGIDAAWLSKAVGGPVRVQGVRHEEHGWDPKDQLRSTGPEPPSTRTAW
jgi:hypothetical protein